MTWIVDNTGTRWVEPTPRKRRATPKAIRFAGLKVGDQVMQKPRPGWRRAIPAYYLVTDLWFDPVLGQVDPTKGAMVGYQHIGKDGAILARKSSTTLRGLASQQFEYADMDFIAHCQKRNEGVVVGIVVGIGMGQVIRKRPKMPGARF